jgi:hypothetical protein
MPASAPFCASTIPFSFVMNIVPPTVTAAAFRTHAS